MEHKVEVIPKEEILANRSNAYEFIDFDKQETLEEDKLRQLFKNRSNCYADSEDVVQAMDENCFIETIKEWQQERSCSEEDLKEAFKEGYTIGFRTSIFEVNLKQENCDEWFEQFKNK